MDFTIPILKELNEQLVGGVISPNDCLKVLNKIQSERLDLKAKCDALLTLNHAEQSALRMEKYNDNPEWFNLRSKLIQAWRDTRTSSNKEVVEQIGYLPDADLKKLKPYSDINITNKGVTEIFKTLEDLILIPKR